MSMKVIWSKPWTIIALDFDQKLHGNISSNKDTIGDGISRGPGQNVTTFSSIAPSSEELWVQKES